NRSAPGYGLWQRHGFQSRAGDPPRHRPASGRTVMHNPAGVVPAGLLCYDETEFRERGSKPMQNHNSVPGAEIALEGAVNFRELGGYPAGDGRRVRYGLLYRGGNLDALQSPADRAV